MPFPLRTREVILVAVTAVLFGGIGFVAGDTGSAPTASPNLNSLPDGPSSATPSPSPSPSFEQLQINPYVAAPLPTITIPGEPPIHIIGCTDAGSPYQCTNPTTALGAAAYNDEATASTEVAPAPTTADGRRAAVFLHALTLDHCSSGGCSQADSNLAKDVIASVKTLRVDEAQQTLNLWNSFLSDPCSFTAPYPPAYQHPASCYDHSDLGQLFGTKDTTPSEAQFQAWGRQEALSQFMTASGQLYANTFAGSIARLTPTTDAVAKAIGVVDSSGSLTSAASTLLAPAVKAGTLSAVESAGSAADVPLVEQLFPYAARAAYLGDGASESAAEVLARLAGTISDAAGFSVGIIVAAAGILVQRVIDLADAVNPSQVSTDLANALTAANATTPTIGQLASDHTGASETDMLDALAVGYGADTQQNNSSTTTWDGGTGNALANGDAEADDPGLGLDQRPVQSWGNDGTPATVRAYDDATPDATAECGVFSRLNQPCGALNHLINRRLTGSDGVNYFWGGSNTAYSDLTQTVQFNGHSAGNWILSGECFSALGSYAVVRVHWLGSHGQDLGSSATVKCSPGGFPAQSFAWHQNGSVPAGTTAADVILSFYRGALEPLGGANPEPEVTDDDAAVDNVSLTLS